MSDDDKNWHDEFVRKVMAEASRAHDGRSGP